MRGPQPLTLERDRTNILHLTANLRYEKPPVNWIRLMVPCCALDLP